MSPLHNTLVAATAMAVSTAAMAFNPMGNMADIAKLQSQAFQNVPPVVTCKDFSGRFVGKCQVTIGSGDDAIFRSSESAMTIQQSLCNKVEVVPDDGETSSTTKQKLSTVVDSYAKFTSHNLQGLNWGSAKESLVFHHLGTGRFFGEDSRPVSVYSSQSLKLAFVDDAEGDVEGDVLRATGNLRSYAIGDEGELEPVPFGYQIACEWQRVTE